MTQQYATKIGEPERRITSTPATEPVPFFAPAMPSSPPERIEPTPVQVPVEVPA